MDHSIIKKRTKIFSSKSDIKGKIKKNKTRRYKHSMSGKQLYVKVNSSFAIIFVNHIDDSVALVKYFLLRKAYLPSTFTLTVNYNGWRLWRVPRPLHIEDHFCWFQNNRYILVATQGKFFRPCPTIYVFPVAVDVPFLHYLCIVYSGFLSTYWIDGYHFIVRLRSVVTSAR